MACLVKVKSGRGTDNCRYYVRLWLPHKKQIRSIPTNTSNKKEAAKVLKRVEEIERYRNAEEKAFVSLYEDFMEERGWDNSDLGYKDQTVTLKKASSDYLESCKNRISMGTIKTYESGLVDMMNALTESIRITDLNKRDYDKVLTYLKSKYNDTTVNIRLRGIRAFLNWSVENDYIEKMPFNVKMVKIEESLPKFITPEEMDRIYSNVGDPNLVSIFRVYEATGMRLSELKQSKLEDNFLRVVGKGKKERIIPIPEMLLNDYHIAKKVDYDRIRISKAFTRAKRKAGIKGNKTLHSLRHTFALRMLVELGDIYLVKKLLGHSSVTVTEVYTKFPIEYLKKVFDSKADQLRASA